MIPYTLSRKLVAEFLGTALLLAVVVGSGIMAERLADGNMAVALIGNTLATGAALAVLILILGPISGCHINPAVTFSFLIQREIGATLAALYLVMQLAGAAAGVGLAHIMFDLPFYFPSFTARTGIGQWTGELVATFGLVATIMGCLKLRPAAVPFAVALYITSGYWFTSSTSFANPAVTLGRAFTDTFSGIRPEDAPAFILAQLAGALLATVLFRWLLDDETEPAPDEDEDILPPEITFGEDYRQGP